MPLQNFVDGQQPTIGATWLNKIDAFYTTLFGSATTAAAARTAILPTQAGATDKVLSSNGTDVSFSHEVAAAKTANAIPLRDASGNLPDFTALNYYINVKDPTYGAVGNGSTDDTVAINAALAAVAASGGTVFFPAGTYKITNTLNIKSNTTLLGVGKGSIIQPAATMAFNTYFTGLGLSQIVCMMNANPGTSNTNICVNGLSVDQSLINQSYGFAMHFRNCTYVSVLNCFTAEGQDGISFTSCTYYLVQGNTCTKHVNAHIDMWENSSYGLIQGNVIVADVADTVSYGILVTGLTILHATGTTHNIVIAHNEVYNTSLVGIWLQGGYYGAGPATGSCEQCMVVGNKINTVNVAHGIRASEGTGHLIAENHIYNVALDGINLVGEVTNTGAPTHCTVTGNHMKLLNTLALTAYGVSIGGGATDIFINANRIAGGGYTYGIRVAGTGAETKALRVHLGENFIDVGAASTTAGYVADLGTGTIGGGYSTGWTAVSYTANWADFGATFQAVQYMRGANGRVYIRGVAKSTGAVTNPVFVLPVGFRPPADVSVATMSTSTVGANEFSFATIRAATGNVETLDVTTPQAVGFDVSFSM